MKRKYLGIICLIYSVIIIYIKITDNLKNYLAPNLQIYLLISLPIISILGVNLLIGNDKTKFKVSDLFLLMPLIMLVLARDSKLSLNLASNRSSNFMKDSMIKPSQYDSKLEDITENSSNNDIMYNIEKIDFAIKDDVYNILANMVTFNENPDKLVGKTIKVRGFTLLKHDLVPSGYFAIGKYLISCCAADAEFEGFVAKYNKGNIKDNTWYEIEGILEKGIDNQGYQIVTINVINIKEIDSKEEDIYVYPCYAYGDSTCSSLNDYEIE